MSTTTIPAEVHTDDRTAETTFDAISWFQQASDQEILDLANCEWGGDYPADAVAEFYNNPSKENPQVAEVFQTLEILRRKNNIGFECHVNEEPALAWLKEHRPWLHSKIINEDVEIFSKSIEEILTLKMPNGETVQTHLESLARKTAQQKRPSWSQENTTVETHLNPSQKTIHIIVKKSQDPEYQEIQFSSPEDFNTAAQKTGLPSTSNRLLVKTEIAETILKDLQAQGIPCNLIPSTVTEEDMWPAWPEDQPEKTIQTLEVKAKIHIALATTAPKEKIQAMVETHLEKVLEEISQTPEVSGEGCALLDDKKEITILET